MPEMFDQMPHNTESAYCWCRPRIEEYRYGRVIIHNEERWAWVTY